jgi:ribonuclease P protein component
MLKKSQRLNLKTSFKWVRSGRRDETPNLILFSKLGDNSTALVGISLSSKIFKKSHDRNRARRLASQAIQNLYTSLLKGLNLVIMPKDSVLQAQVGDLEAELTEVLGKMKQVS